MREIILCEIVENVALILCGVGGAKQSVFSRSLIEADASIMTGRNVASPEFTAALLQCTEFEMTVAVYAGVRRFARDIGVTESLDHIIEKVRLHIENVVIDPQLAADLFCIVEVLERAATRFLPVADERVSEKLHGNADDIESLVDEQLRRDGTVDAAAHGG